MGRLVERLAQGDEARRSLLATVGRSVRWGLQTRGRWDGVIEEALPSVCRPLHMPALRETLGALIPESLHPSLDKAVAKGKDVYGPLRGLSQLRIDCWGVNVRNEDALANGRLQTDALEFFLLLLKRLGAVLGWPCLVASHTVGKAVGQNADAEQFARVAQAWRKVWQREGLAGMKELVLPVAVDMAAKDWVCVAVRCVDEGAALDSGKRLRTMVFDGFARGTVAARVARNVDVLVRGLTAQVVGAEAPLVQPSKMPAGGFGMQRILAAFGCVVERVFSAGGEAFLDTSKESFLTDFARVLRRIFAHLREEVGARGARDVGELLVDKEFCKELVLMFSSVPSLVQRGEGVVRIPLRLLGLLSVVRTPARICRAFSVWRPGISRMAKCRHRRQGPGP